jgi:DEAD/DEAH box helicase domain-containing protein
VATTSQPISTPWRTLLDAGRADGRLVREAFEAQREPRHEPLPHDLHPALADGLTGAGIDQLYSHQAEAWEAAVDGPFIVTTGTASGKSLCFNLPVLDVLCTDTKARAIYLYPTKALAQDQARAVGAFGLGDRVRPAIYTGDTPKEQRAQIRKSANLILTNPDMLHVGILPNHAAWANLFTNLAAVVVDEAHVYRGVFGSHVGNVLRRLRRIAGAYGSSPRILLASATIANPVELTEELTGLDDITHIAADGSPGVRRQIAMWNPPVIDEAIGTRRSALGEAADVITELVSGGARTIAFVKSRKAVELVASIAADQLADRDPALRDRIAPYRAGYTAQQRRELEQRLVSGDLLAVVTTDALELGIDIGALDASVVVTFPGTVASLKQMWGRAGRRGQGLAMYIAGEDALDQFFCRHPDEFLDRAVEAAFTNYENETIHDPHLLCAAFEGPIDADSSAERTILGPRLRAHCEHLAASGVLRERNGLFTPREREAYPAGEISLRSGSAETVAIVDLSAGEVLGTVEMARAFSTVHDGAIYLHQGRRYRVEQFDHQARQALVAPSEEPYYTQPKKETDTTIERLLDRRDTCGVVLSYGMVSVSETVIAYQRKRLGDHSVIDLHTLDLPQTTYTTQAIWYEPSRDVLGSAVPIDQLLGALHATEHAQIAVLPLLAMCDRWDIGGLSTNLHQQTSGPTIFIFDGHPGGVGITAQAFREFERLAQDAHRLISECPCESGCPSCVQSPKCGNLNEFLAKDAAAALLQRMIATG